MVHMCVCVASSAATFLLRSSPALVRSFWQSLLLMLLLLLLHSSTMAATYHVDRQTMFLIFNTKMPGKNVQLKKLLLSRATEGHKHGG